MKRKDIHNVVERAIHDDENAFNELCVLIAKDILYMCIKFTRHVQDGEDAAQEAFIKIKNGIGHLKDPDAFHVWVNRVILSACNDVYRDKKKWRNVELGDENLPLVMEDNMNFLPPEYAEDNDKRQALAAAVDALPDKYRKAILLYYYEGMAQKDMAHVLDASVDSVEHTLRRARAAVRKTLEARFGPMQPVQNGAQWAAVPVLGIVLGAEADTLVTREMMLRCLRGPVLGGAGRKGGRGGKGGTAGKGTAGLAYKGMLVVSAVSTIILSVLAITSGTSYAATSVLSISSTAPGPMMTMVPQPSSVTGAVEALLPLEPASSRPASSAIHGSAAQPRIVSRPAAAPAPSAAPASAGRPPAARPGSSAQPAQPQAQMAGVSGRLVFTGAAGDTLPAGQRYAEGCVVTLLQNGNTVATATAAADGGYTVAARIVAKGEYVLHISSPPGRNYLFEGSGRAVSIPVRLEPGASAPTVRDVAFTDDTVPQLEVLYYNAEGVRTRTNPASAQIAVLDDTDVHCTWQVLDEKNNPVHSGEGTAIEMGALPGGRYTRTYTIVVRAVDAVGNTSQTSGTFFITPAA